ncbi:ABC transporter ATP-binding protein [Starkeya sp. ORNL1]|uniref:ABC transporter ATP-binding protein n=1 Tax=Starkeya sp. ORNL1 TaxID=2709380 RepID=UPI0014640BC7|nr:ABC transporter ATP-binding protein [Starkeya sp. ORNL1]QJP14947.1 ABC transporter ATP-binding protein [Starkeya sp. ORNL1]
MNANGRVPMLEIVSLRHQYGAVVAVDDVSLAVAAGEFLTILGESGSGKTTILRVIAGLERPTSVARLAIAGEDVRELPAAKRNCTTVFQNYALFPHMSVGENVAYGLSVRGVPAAQAREEAMKALEIVRLSGMADRRIAQLSGGQKQRAALARCLVTRPAIMLLDEPLGALDERLRLDMQTELVELRRRLGMTFIYITHSQEEALTMSDRIVLMSRGRIAQSGTPVELFDRPVSRFAAAFMGFENILPGAVAEIRDGTVAVDLEGAGRVTGVWTGAGAPALGQPASIALRAERAALAASPEVAAPGLNVLPGRQVERLYRGKYVDQTLESGAGRLKVRTFDRETLGEPGAVVWKPEDCVVLAA